MITKTNQTNLYTNEVIRDAIKIIRKGESAVLYYRHDIEQVIKAFGKEKLQIYRAKANTLFPDMEMDVYFVSYKDEIILTLAYAKEKLAFFKDAEIHISQEEKYYLLNLPSKVQIETYFWTLYDKYTEEVQL